MTTAGLGLNEQIVAVTANVTPIAYMLRPGTTIYNSSSLSSVWVGTSPGVVSGQGMRIGPMGNAVWQGEGKPAYAVLDTASTEAVVILTLSSNIGPPDNPVDVGVAIAAQLLASGVPNVLNNVLLGITFGLAAGASTLLDIHQYAALTVIANGTASLVLELEYHQNTLGTGIAYSEFLTNIDGNNVAGAWILPISAGSVRIWNRSANAINLVVYASNRPVPAATMQGGSYPPRYFNTGNIAWVNGVGQVLPSADGGPSSTMFNRSIYYSFTSGTIAGQLYCQFIGRDGNINNIFVTSCAANTSVTGVIAHPLSVCNWLMLPSATGNATAQLRVVQNVVS